MIPKRGFKLLSKTFRNQQSCFLASKNVDTEVEKKQQTDPVNTVTSQSKYSMELPKSNFKWRTPWHEQHGVYFSYMRIFYSEESKVDSIRSISAPIDLSVEGIRNWFQRKKVEHEVQDQQYIRRRNEVLGNELAAAHFIVHRGGAVKFYGEYKILPLFSNHRRIKLFCQIP